jgi:hypothetical protein
MAMPRGQVAFKSDGGAKAYIVSGLTVDAMPMRTTETPGARPGDEALTCEQIEAELRPMMEAMASFQQSPMIQGAQGRAEGAFARRREETAKTAAKSAASAVESVADAMKDVLGFGFGRKRRHSYAEAQQQADFERARTDAAKQNMELERMMGDVRQVDPSRVDPARVERLIELAEKKKCDVVLSQLSLTRRG